MVKQTGEQYQLLANGHNNNVVLAHSSKTFQTKKWATVLSNVLEGASLPYPQTKEYWGITSSKAFSFERSVDFKVFISV